MAGIRERARYALEAQDDTQRAFASVRGSLVGLTARFARFAGPLGLGAAAIGILRFSQQLGETQQNLELTALRVGATAGELAGLRAAGAATGVAFGTIDIAVQRFQRRVGEAVQGSSQLREVLERIGTSADVLQQLGAAEGLITFLEAVTEGRDQTEALADAARLLDSEGVALLQTFQALGAEGLRRFITQAERTNAAVEVATRNFQQAQIEAGELELKTRELTAGFAGLGITIRSRVLSAFNDVLEAAGRLPERLAGIRTELVDIANVSRLASESARDRETNQREAQERTRLALQAAQIERNQIDFRDVAFDREQTRRRARVDAARELIGLEIERLRLLTENDRRFGGRQVDVTRAAIGGVTVAALPAESPEAARLRDLLAFQRQQDLKTILERQNTLLESALLRESQVVLR